MQYTREQLEDVRIEKAEQLIKLVALTAEQNGLMAQAEKIDPNNMPPQYRRIWDHALACWTAAPARPFSLDTFMGLTEDHDVFKARVINALRLPLNERVAEELAADITDLGRRLRLESIGALAAWEALDLERPVGAIESKLIDQIADNVPTEVKAVDFESIAMSVMAKGYEYHLNPAPWRGMASGWSALDHLMGGAERKTFLITAARPGMGKSAEMMMKAVRQAMAGYHVYYASLENSAESTVTRMIAQHAQVSTYRYKLGFDEQEWGQFSIGGNDLIGALGGRLVISEQGGSTKQLFSEARRVQRELGLDIMYIDTLDKLQDTTFNDNRTVAVTNASLAVHDACRAYDIAIEAAKQLNRANETRNDKRPNLSDLRDSGAVEQDADKVLFIHRPAYYDKDDDPTTAADGSGIAEHILAKHRDGPTGMVCMYFEATWPGFRPATRQELIDYGISFADIADSSAEDNGPTLDNPQQEEMYLDD